MPEQLPVPDAAHDTLLPTADPRVWMKRMLHGLIAAGALSMPLAAQEQQEQTRAQIVARLLKEAEGSYEQLSHLLGHSDAAVRSGAHSIILKKSTGEVEKSRKAFSQPSLFHRQKEMSLERWRRLEAIQLAVQDAEYQLHLRHGTVFRAPASWNKPGNTETFGEALRILSSHTEQPLATLHASQQFLDEKVPTADLDGKLFWHVLSSLQTKKGYGAKVTSNDKGSLNVLQDDSIEKSQAAVSGPVCAHLTRYASLPHHLHIGFETEPRLKLAGRRIETVSVIRPEGARTPAAIASEEGRQPYWLKVELPRATKETETVTVEVVCDLTATRGTTVHLADLTKKQSFEQSGYSLHVLPPERQDDGMYLLKAELHTENNGLDPRIASQLGMTTFDGDGKEIVPLCYHQTEPFHTQSVLWQLPRMPVRSRLYLPDLNTVTVRHTFTFPGVTLSTAEPVR